MGVRSLDHIVLRVADIERSLAWYRDELGLAWERVEEWRAGEVFFPSLRVDATTLIDLLPMVGEPTEPQRIDHVCFVVDGPIIERFVADDRHEIIDGPDTRFGARGDATSIYLRDPDGLVVELRAYPADSEEEE